MVEQPSANPGMSKTKLWYDIYIYNIYIYIYCGMIYICVYASKSVDLYLKVRWKQSPLSDAVLGQ